MWLGWGNEIDRANRADRSNKTDRTNRANKTNKTNRTDRANKIDGANRTNKTNKIGGAGTQIGMMGMGRMKKQRSATEGKANLLPPVGLGIINN